MTYLVLSAGLGGLWLSLYRGARIDASWPLLVAQLRRWLASPAPPPGEDRELLRAALPLYQLEASTTNDTGKGIAP